MTKKILKHIMYTAIVFIGVIAIYVAMGWVALWVASSFFGWDDYRDWGGLGIIYYSLIFDVIAIYPCIAYWYSRKLVSNEKYKSILSLISPLAILLPFFIWLTFVVDYGDNYYRYLRYLIYTFGWFWSWSLLGAFKPKNTENTENNENTENESTESED